MHLLTVQRLIFLKGSLIAVYRSKGGSPQITRIMRLTAILLTAFCLQVAARSNGQAITLSVKETPIEKVFAEIKKQSGYRFIYGKELIGLAKPVSLTVKSTPLPKVLQLLFQQQPLDYQMVDDYVIIRAGKPAVPVMDKEEAAIQPAPTLIDIKGRVVDEEGKPVAGASVQVKGAAGKGVSTNTDGYFELKGLDENVVLVISGVNIESRELKVSGKTALGDVVVKLKVAEGEEILIISTGYQQLRQEETTGSYSYIDNKLINRSIGSDILSRLEAVTSSLAFIRKDIIEERERHPVLRIRGKNTIYGDESPLIIMDNFPYEGDIYNINPNDIQNVTILKDAAASAIWGARAGNGVIVITTKKGQYRQTSSVNFVSNFTVQQKPDLFYSPYFMSSQEFIEVERELFNRGFYIPADWTVFSPAVESLFSNNASDEFISGLSKVDFRKEVSRLFYRNGFRQQYALNFKGGGEKYNYFVSGGFDENKATIRRNNDRRITLQTNFAFKPYKSLEFTFGHSFIMAEESPNGIGISSMYSSGKQALLPYTVFVDQDGNSAAINRSYRQTYVDAAEANGLLNWQYMPYEELYLNDRKNNTLENRIIAGIKYAIIPSLSTEMKYQFQQTTSDNYQNYHVQSFYARDMVNRFTQSNGSRIIPVGAIHQGNGSELTDHSFRMQLNYAKKLAGKHLITGMAGTEIRQKIKERKPGFILYGVNSDILVGQIRFDYRTWYTTRPNGISTIPAPSSNIEYLTNRFLSYYGSFSYLYNDKYNITFSLRKDGTNFYGIKANQKFVPLWHAGLGWIISQEDFWSNKDNFLKVRGTLGYSGNSLNSVTAFITARYRTNSFTGVEMAELMSPGNPSLQWEKVLTKNIGIDFKCFAGRLNGNIDYYTKDGIDLIGDNIIDPTTGLGFYAQGTSIRLSNRTNYASTHTKGIEIEVTSLNTVGNVKWNTSFLINTAKSRITHYDGLFDPNIFSYLVRSDGSLPIAGRPIDPLYSLPWYGLSSVDGSPLVPVNGNLSTDYGMYINQLKPEDLILSGSSVPLLQGSMRNTIDFGGLSFSTNFSWKSGYYFRESGINYYNLFNNWLGHQDFTQRWKMAGDELLTNVPSMPTSNNYDVSGRRDLVYTSSQILVRKADHIRWNDINVNYSFNNKRFKKLPAKSIQLSFYVQNLGIIWRASSSKIDPDLPYASYPLSTSFSFGFNANF